MEEVSPDIQLESPRVSLPPPIIPETEDSTPSPVSETSSGYICTSISTATLSDVYTLSWDLPPPSCRRTDGCETEEESSAAEPQPLTRESLLVWDEAAEEKTEPVPSGPASGPALRTPEGPRQTEQEPDSKTKLESAQTQELGPPSQEAVPQTKPGQDRTSFGGARDPAPGQIPEDPQVSVPTPASPGGGRVYPNVAETEATPEVPSSSFVPSDDVPVAPGPAQPGVPPSKANPTGTTPFKIQKVKSSDLKSFQPILGMDEAAAPQADRTCSLAAPLESLEIISDSEGDAAAVALPDWLKEGEFVTVGGNKCGTIRYVGPADFAEGTWVGVELEVPAGE